uniref:Uncharacterized protein n=1 Tax=Fervidicoccus fontis TaxID=683846 RepID=A0A7J3ZLP6_9CREN
MTISEHVVRKLEVLRELDDQVDFARSAMQLNIILTLAFYNKPLTTEALATILGERRKAVLDALRKLESKNLVAKTSGENGIIMYELSNEGKEYTSKLLRLLGEPSTQEALIHEAEEEISGAGKSAFLKGVLYSQHLLNAIVALANTEGNAMELKRIAYIMGLSIDRARSYLDMLSRPPNRVFRRLNHPLKGVMYKLDKGGLEIYYRTRIYTLAKNNPLYRFKLKIQSRHPWILRYKGAILGSTFMLATGGLFVLLYYLTFPFNFVLSLLLLAFAWLAFFFTA